MGFYAVMQLRRCDANGFCTSLMLTFRFNAPIFTVKL